jgi:drug/metabolite transporter (DMT)-like permease
VTDERRTFLTGLALAVAGSVLFSAKAIVVKLAYRHGVDAATLIALRMAFAAPFFVVAYAVSSRGAPPLTARDHARLIVIGLLGYYAASYLDFLGLQYISAALERLILYLNPTIVLLLSALVLGKRFSRREIAALGLAYGGIVFVFLHDVHLDGDGSALGAALVFASAVCYAGYLVMSGELVRRLGAIRLTSYAMCVSTLAVGVQFALLRPATALLQPAPVLWLSLVNGVLCTVLPVFATMLAVERIGAGRTSLAAMVGPVATIALAFVFLGEAISGWQLAGTALVLTGIYVLSRPAAAPARLARKENP